MRAFRCRLASATLTVVSALAVGASPQAAELPTLTLDRLFATPSLTGTRPSAPVWAPDSRHFAFTWNSEGLPQRDVWLARADGSELRRLAPDGPAAGSVSDVAWLPDSSRILSLRDGALWSTDVDDGRNSRVAATGEGASTLTVSPDGKLAAYLRGGDLWLVDLAAETQSQATRIGIVGLSSLPVGRYSRPEREIGPGIWSGPTYAWSPDGRHIAVHYVDRRDMRKVPFPDYLAPETDPNEVRRGYPGDPNEFRTVGLLRVADRDLRLLDLEEPTSNQVVDFAWSPKGVLLLDLASDTNVDRWLYTVDPDDDRLRLIWHSNRPNRGYTAFASAWHPDGEQVIFLSDIGDRYGLYVLQPDSNSEPGLITDPGYDVLGSLAVVPAADSVYYSANGVDAYNQHVYRVAAGGGTPTRVTDSPGHNTGYPSPDGRHLAFMHSDDVTPAEIFTLSGDGGDARRVTTSPPPEFREFSWVAGRYVSFPSRIDDYELHARILEPPDLDAEGRYPVLFGPVYSNTVRNRWSGVYSRIQQLLVQKGYIVVQVDVRGSTGYGRAFREEFVLDFAGEDLEDLASAVEYLQSLPYVDEERIGIWGSSYGGTLTVYSLLKKPGLFCAGVAAASAVDPHFFGTDDVAIVRRPATDPRVFENQAVRWADSLEDHLLLIHGMQDQVVPFKTTAVLAEALIKAGKNFDFAFAPGATHGWSREPDYQRYLFGKMLEHFARYLMTPGGCDSDADDGLADPGNR